MRAQRHRRLVRRRRQKALVSARRQHLADRFAGPLPGVHDQAFRLIPADVAKPTPGLVSSR